MTLPASVAIGSTVPYRPSPLMRLFVSIDGLPFGGLWIYPVLVVYLLTRVAADVVR